MSRLVMQWDSFRESMLMALAAILPTGGELVMLYAGALAAGAFSESVVPTT